MAKRAPSVIVLAGPNGAGKSTSAPMLLKGTLGVTEFVNADVLAHGLSAFEPERVALAAGKIMLARLKELARARRSFAFETTLASRSFAPWIAGLKKQGYRFHLIFLWLPSADAAVARVTERVRMGGHSVPEETVRRRYVGGLRNLFSLYMPLATTWRVYDNYGQAVPELIASGTALQARMIVNSKVWKQLTRKFNQ